MPYYGPHYQAGITTSQFRALMQRQLADLPLPRDVVNKIVSMLRVILFEFRLRIEEASDIWWWQNQLN